MKNAFIFVAILFFVGCGDRSSATGQFIQGCEASGLSYKDCSCLAEKVIEDMSDENFRNTAYLRNALSNIDEKILKKCIGKQDAKSMIEKIFVSQRIPKKNASCLANKILKQMNSKDIQLLETPVFGLSEEKQKKINTLNEKIMEILMDENFIRSCQ